MSSEQIQNDFSGFGEVQTSNWNQFNEFMGSIEADNRKTWAKWMDTLGGQY